MTNTTNDEHAWIREKAFQGFKVLSLTSLPEIDYYHKTQSARLLESRTGYFLNRSRKRIDYKNMKTQKEFTSTIHK
jgi:hypothetical protein